MAQCLDEGCLFPRVIDSCSSGALTRDRAIGMIRVRRTRGREWREGRSLEGEGRGLEVMRARESRRLESLKLLLLEVRCITALLL